MNNLLKDLQSNGFKSSEFLNLGDIDADGNKVSAETPIETQVGEDVIVYIASASPETADPNVDSFTVMALDAEGNESYSVFGSYDEGMISVTAYKVGEYTIQISTKNVVKTFKLLLITILLIYFNVQR